MENKSNTSSKISQKFDKSNLSKFKLSVPRKNLIPLGYKFVKLFGDNRITYWRELEESQMYITYTLYNKSLEIKDWSILSKTIWDYLQEQPYLGSEKDYKLIYKNVFDNTLFPHTHKQRISRDFPYIDCELFISKYEIEWVEKELKLVNALP